MFANIYIYASKNGVQIRKKKIIINIYELHTIGSNFFRMSTSIESTHMKL